ncbi:hypothetical protein POX_g08797 [Penicillium oxalicum]|uniref:Uncharacterized protein n=1 Tax=Penicillium oxalicum (strain 114-2 / CGMCC 5302) TaxID=933388 RepID=S8AM16_PENO1|nr:hypothetical protein POX_g08797 [Penicillium oxalicum]EPS26903.1 hypothetical protein PDE_01843 [Penicillium oxalicum 114-2]KAI2786412.1 hypothetical protein POX_g08797 [Penicillium oxalicum]
MILFGEGARTTLEGQPLSLTMPDRDLQTSRLANEMAGDASVEAGNHSRWKLGQRQGSRRQCRINNRVVLDGAVEKRA